MDCPLVTLAARRFLVHDPSMIFVLRGHGAYEYVADVIGALFITHPFTLLEDISQHEGADKIWKPCTKNAVLLHYRGVNGEKEIIHTWEGDLVALRERDYIIKGLEGEEYPIEKSLFSRLYMIGDSPGKS